MTPKETAFVREFRVDRNATKAAVRAGYSKRTAGSAGQRLLKKVEIRAAIDAEDLDLAARVGLTCEMVLRERKRIAFFDPRQLLDSEGNPKPLQDLDADTAAAIAGLEVVQVTGSEAIPGVISYVKRFKLGDKNASLASLEKYLGLHEKPVRFALPKIANAEDCAKAQLAVLEAVAAGRLGSSEAKLLSDLIDGQRRAYETQDILERMEAMEKTIADLLKQRGVQP